MSPASVASQPPPPPPPDRQNKNRKSQQKPEKKVNICRDLVNQFVPVLVSHYIKKETKKQVKCDLDRCGWNCQCPASIT